MLRSATTARSSSTAGRLGGRWAAVFLLVTGALLASTTAASAAPGSRGAMIKLDDLGPARASSPGNDVRVGCDFDVDLYGFQVPAEGDIATLIFEAAPKHAAAVALRADSVLLVPDITGGESRRYNGSSPEYHVAIDFLPLFAQAGVAPEGNDAFRVRVTVVTSTGSASRLFSMAAGCVAP